MPYPGGDPSHMVAAGMPAWTFARAIDLEQEPVPAVRDPRYRELSAVALAEATSLGCSYADIRFTRNRSQSMTLRNGQISTAGGHWTAKTDCSGFMSYVLYKVARDPQYNALMDFARRQYRDDQERKNRTPRDDRCVHAVSW